MISSGDYLPLSGIQHFAMCRRQWALIHIEQQWDENHLTAEGRIQHEKAHDEYRVETRGDLIISRGMRVLSHALRLQGSCDVVEFHRGAEGVPLKGREGLWQPFPIEYKRGREGVSTAADSIQLCCQAICLEEMLCCPVTSGALFYQSSRKRVPVQFDAALRQQALHLAEEMNSLYERGHTPRVKAKRGCRSCSLKELCLPELLGRRSVDDYLQAALKEVTES